MATAPSVSYRHNVAKGEHEIGVKIDGQFVPFASVSDAVVAQRVENAENVKGADKAAAEEAE